MPRVPNREDQQTSTGRSSGLRAMDRRGLPKLLFPDPRERINQRALVKLVQWPTPKLPLTAARPRRNPTAFPFHPSTQRTPVADYITTAGRKCKRRNFAANFSPGVIYRDPRRCQAHCFDLAPSKRGDLNPRLNSLYFGGTNRGKIFRNRPRRRHSQGISQGVRRRQVPHLSGNETSQ